MIAVLFAQPRGVYSTFDDVDLWDEARDARKYDGPHPVVAHPPCSRWCQLAHIIEKRYGHKVGDDGGLFAFALDAVRRWGGVLEHPAETIAWRTFDLRTPHRYGGWLTTWCGGWVCQVERTWLYAYGIERPTHDVIWRRAHPTATVSQCRNHGGGDLPRLSKKEASATPRAFAEMLIALAASAGRSANRRAV